MAENRFCSACGTPLVEGTAFCTKCGTRAAADPSPFAVESHAAAGAQQQSHAPDTTAAEPVRAVVGNLTVSGGFMGFKPTTYSLVITDRRLIFAELTKERMTAIVNGARDAAKAEGKGFFGQWGAQIGTSFNYHEAYGQMSPDAALAETPGNFAIERSEIQSIKFKVGTAYDDRPDDPDYVIIKTASGKHKLKVGGTLSAVKDAFHQAGLA